MIKLNITFIFLFLTHFSFANENVLDKYVKMGLESNLALKQQEISLEQSMQALKEARGMFFPSIDINARYSRAGGGRTIDFPVGDLMNPVYQTLNQLLQQQQFPTNIENVTIPFLREEEHETKIRLTQPIFQPAIYYNYKAKSDLSDLKKAEFKVFKRKLTAEIKTAYFNYLKTNQVVDIYDKTKQLLEENLRISEKLFQAQKVTKDVIYRAKTELSSLEQKIMKAENQQKLAQAYFNFLLNKPLDSSITVKENFQLPDDKGMTFETARANALKNREELQQLKSAIFAAGHGAAALKSNYFPGLTAVLDYGFEGEKYKFGEKDDYWMGSLVLQWNLFKGFQDQAKIERAELEKKKLQTQLEEEHPETLRPGFPPRGKKQLYKDPQEESEAFFRLQEKIVNKDREISGTDEKITGIDKRISQIDKEILRLEQKKS